MSSNQAPNDDRNPSQKSSADLAPFVAAVLKDRSVHDLAEENERLKDRNKTLVDQALQIKICNHCLILDFDYDSGGDTKLGLASLKNGYLLRDGSKVYSCVEIPVFRDDGYNEGDIIEVYLSGVMV